MFIYRHVLIKQEEDEGLYTHLQSQITQVQK